MGVFKYLLNLWVLEIHNGFFFTIQNFICSFIFKSEIGKFQDLFDNYFFLIEEPVAIQWKDFYCIHFYYNLEGYDSANLKQKQAK